MFAYGNMIRYDPTLVELPNNFFFLCTNVIVFYIIIHSGWSVKVYLYNYIEWVELSMNIHEDKG